MAIVDRIVQGADPAGAFDLLQATSISAATWRQGSSAHEALTTISGGPGYSNSWVDFGGSEATGAFYKDALGRVHLRGTVKSGTAGAAIFTLPSGYRPGATRNFAIDAGGTPASLSITSAGVVTPSAAAGNTQVSLDGVSFEL